MWEKLDLPVLGRFSKEICIRSYIYFVMFEKKAESALFFCIYKQSATS